jgi:hypothetical protein
MKNTFKVKRTTNDKYGPKRKLLDRIFQCMNKDVTQNFLDLAWQDFLEKQKKLLSNS